MNTAFIDPVQLPAIPLFAEVLGFRSGDKGTHTSRTIMLVELQSLLRQLPPESGRYAFQVAITEDNSLGKRTVATRKLTNQRLGELYGLDPSVPLFRILRELWDRDPRSQSQLALLCALARDPLLRATAIPVLALSNGQELSRQAITEAIREAVGNRLNDDILDKVARNASSSWAQSGHLEGRTRKIRRKLGPTPISAAYALAIGVLLGIRGKKLLHSFWASVLDASSSEMLDLAREAHRLGLLDLKVSDEVIEVHFPKLLLPDERKDRYGQD